MLFPDPQKRLEKMIRRWTERDVMEGLETRRGIHLTGARQSGKTTLAESLVIPGAKHYTLDDDTARAAAFSDPMGFVERQSGQTLVIDEVQKAPPLLNAIKQRLDHDNSRGQYLLTGSSNLRFSKAIKDSLAGRLGTVRLRTLALGEILGGEPAFLPGAFDGKFDMKGRTPLSKRDVLRLAFEGGYPEPREFPVKARIKWYASYLDDLLEKDIRDITEIRKVEVLRQMAFWLAAHSARFFSMEELGAKAGVMKPTAESYLAALRALYLFDQVPAWSKSDYDRLGKRPKWMASDSGLVANLLRWNEEDTYLDPQRSGPLVETWVYQQLATQIDLLGGYEISHYRDSDKREIDFLVERDDGAILGIEVKAGQALSEGDFRHLRWFSEKLACGSFTGIVLYTGSDLLKFGDRFFAVPMACLG